MIFDYEKKVLQIKIVYYGPAMSGKTTSIKFLFSYFKKDNFLESIENSIGRTLFFDFGVLKFQGSQWGLKFLIYSATGQDFYASTRPATLNGVDGIIFVVDSRLEYLKHSLRSWNELKTLFGKELYNLPIVISLNKYDLDGNNKLEKSDLLKFINYTSYKYLSIEKTTAINGKGVLNSFYSVINFILPELRINSNIFL